VSQEVAEIADRVLPILRRHGVSKASVFGSFARGEMGDQSDLDLLVQIDRDIGLFEFLRIKLEVEETLGRKVDLVEYDAVKPMLRDRILKEQVPIL
jgi:predicted nucleotidyltransferase